MVRIFCLLCTACSASAVLASDFDFSLLPIPVEHTNAVVNNRIPPGVYDVELNVNSASFGMFKVGFVAVADEVVEPCINKELLVAIGIDSGRDQLSFDSHECIVPENGVIEYNFDYNNFLLYIKVNGAFLLNDLDKRIQQLEHGIDSLRINYDVSNRLARYSSGKQGSQNDSYLSLLTRVNIDDWRFVSDGNVTHDNTHGSKFINGTMYGYTPIIERKSVLYVGRKVTQQPLFDMRLFTGVEYMMEPMLYASDNTVPVLPISVFLLKDSTVRLYQNGQQIYQSYLWAGNHEISDYTPIASIDIEVEIEGEDGKSTRFAVPYIMSKSRVMKGTSFYYIGAGVGSETDGVKFITASHQYGVTDWLSLSYGADISSYTISFGSAVDVYLGDLGDVGATLVGNSIESYVDLYYSKSFADSLAGVNISHRSYRYGHEYSGGDSAIQTSRFSLYKNIPFFSVSTNIGFVKSDYIKSGSIIQGSAGLGGVVADVSYNLNYSRTLGSGNNKGTESTFGLSLSIPLDIVGLKGWQLSKGYGSGGGMTSLSASGNYEQGAWGAYVSKQDHISDISLGVSADYHAGISELRGIASTNASSNNIMLGAKGGLLFSEHGMQLSERMSETVMLVHTPNVEGIKYINDRYASSNSAGFTVIDDIRPYSVANVMIDYNSLPDNVELPSLTTTGVASSGAVLYKEMSINTGVPLLIDVTNNHHVEIPFGAQVYVPDYGKPIIAEGNGTVFIPALPIKANSVDVVWSKGKCRIEIDRERLTSEQDLFFLSAPCNSMTF